MKLKRNKASLIVFAVLSVALTFTSFSVLGSDSWNEVRLPTRESPASLGHYSAGCLRGAQALPMAGPGYRVIRLFRMRYFGHPRLVSAIQRLGQQAREHTGGELLIGDMSQPRGGPMSYGHASHQIGLDVDVWFTLYTQDNAALLPTYEEQDPPSMLNSAQGDEVDSRRWSQAQVYLLKTAAGFPEVERIFVNPAIKRALCRTEGNTAWLRKIRPWWGHDDHFHVRLRCPEGSPKCVPQESLPAGDGCGADLAWWFTEEAKLPAKPAKRKPPRLPSACAALLRQ